MAPPVLVSSTTAARALGVHPGTLWRWAQEGRVTPALRTAGGHLRWNLNDLRRQLDAQEAASMSEPATSPEPQPVVAAIVTSHLGVLVGKHNDGKPPWTFIAGGGRTRREHRGRGGPGGQRGSGADGARGAP